MTYPSKSALLTAIAEAEVSMGHVGLDEFRDIEDAEAVALLQFNADEERETILGRGHKWDATWRIMQWAEHMAPADAERLWPLLLRCSVLDVSLDDAVELTQAINLANRSSALSQAKLDLPEYIAAAYERAKPPKRGPKHLDEASGQPYQGEL